MKLLTTLGCLFLTSVCVAQQSPPKAPSDSAGTVDNMPVVRNIGNPARMPVQKDVGTAATMPTHRMGVPAQPEVPFGKELNLIEGQLKPRRSDSLNQVTPRSVKPRKEN